MDLNIYEDFEPKQERRPKRPKKPKRPKRKLTPKQRAIRIVLDAVIVVCLVVAGYMLLTPYLRHRAQDKAAQDLLNQFNKSPDQTVQMSFDAGRYEMPEDGVEDFHATTVPEEPEEVFYVNVIGDLNIPSINLNMPIADNANTRSLWVAIGHYTSSVGFGEPGNAVLFGHRMYSYGRFFNRLNEVQAGQKINISTKAKKYNYTVTKTILIPREELPGHIFAHGDQHQLILVTCDPLRYSGPGPTPNRILVFATLDNP